MKVLRLIVDLRVDWDRGVVPSVFSLFTVHLPPEAVDHAAFSSDVAGFMISLYIVEPGFADRVVQSVQPKFWLIVDLVMDFDFGVVPSKVGEFSSVIVHSDCGGLEVSVCSIDLGVTLFLINPGVPLVRRNLDCGVVPPVFDKFDVENLMKVCLDRGVAVDSKGSSYMKLCMISLVLSLGSLKGTSCGVLGHDISFAMTQLNNLSVLAELKKVAGGVMIWFRYLFKLWSCASSLAVGSRLLQ